MGASDYSERIKELTSRFVGREWLINRIDDHLRQGAASHIVITGEPGIGKSAVAAQMALGGKVHAYHFCNALEGSKLVPSTFIGSLSTQLAKRLPGFADHVAEQMAPSIKGEVNVGDMRGGEAVGLKINNFVVQTTSVHEAFQRLIREPLTGWCAEHLDETVVLLVDGLDEAMRFDARPNIVDLVATSQDLPGRVKWLLTSRPGKHLSRLPGARLLILDDSAENMEDVRLYVAAALDDAAVATAMRSSGVDADAYREQLESRSGGNFLYLRYMLKSLRERVAAGGKVAAPDSLPAGLDELYLEFLNRVLEGKDAEWRRTYRPVLGVLAVAHEALDFRHLVALSGVAAGDVTDVLNDLDQFLDLPRGEPAGSRRIYHTSFIDYLTDRERNPHYWVDAGAFNGRVADYYLTRYGGRWDESDRYGLRYLPAHLLDAGRADELAELLTDFDWLSAKLDAFDAAELLSDFNAPSGADAELVKRVLRQSMHLLVGQKTQLATQIVGRLMHFESARIRALAGRAAAYRAKPWLRPLTPSLRPPGALLQSIPAHNHRIYGAAVAPDGRTVVSASIDHTIKMWRVEDGVELQTLRGHDDGVMGVVVLPDGERVLSASQDGTLKMWRWREGAQLFTLAGHEDWVIAAAVTPDGAVAVSGSQDKTLKVWDLAERKALYTLRGHTDSVWAAAVTPDGALAYSGSWDGTVREWDLKTGQELSVLASGVGAVSAVALTSDGGRLMWASGYGAESSGNVLTVWDRRRGETVFTLSGHRSRITSLAVFPDGRRAVSGCWDNTLRVWDLENGRELRVFENSADIQAVALIDERRVLTGSPDGALKIWDVDVDISMPASSPHAGDVFVLSDAGSGRLLSGAQDGAVKIWEFDDGREVKTFRGHTSMVSAVALAPDGRRLVSGDYNGGLNVWDAEGGALIRELPGHADMIMDVKVSGDGRRIISAGKDKRHKIWDIESGAELRTLQAIEARSAADHFNVPDTEELFATAGEITPDGRHALSALVYGYGRKRCYFVVWDLEAGAGRSVVLGHSDWVNAAAITPDGRLGISGSDDGTLEVWDLEKMERRFVLSEHAGWVRAVAVTPDGRRAVSGDGTFSASQETTVKVWNLETGAEMFALHGHLARITAVAVTRDGRRAVSVCNKGTLKMWDTVGGHELAGFYGDHEFSTCAVAPGGATVAVGDKSGQVHFLRLEGGAA